MGTHLACLSNWLELSHIALPRDEIFCVSMLFAKKKILSPLGSVSMKILPLYSLMENRINHFIFL